MVTDEDNQRENQTCLDGAGKANRRLASCFKKDIYLFHAELSQITNKDEIRIAVRM